MPADGSWFVSMRDCIESLLSNQEVPILIDFSFSVKEKLVELSLAATGTQYRPPPAL